VSLEVKDVEFPSVRQVNPGNLEKQNLQFGTYVPDSDVEV